jgi:hypothetical protein
MFQMGGLVKVEQTCLKPVPWRLLSYVGRVGEVYCHSRDGTQCTVKFNANCVIRIPVHCLKSA